MNDPQAATMVIDKLSSDALQARKDGDGLKKEILQSTLARITNAEAVAPAPASSMSVGVGSTEAARRELSLPEVYELIQQEIDELTEAYKAMDSQPAHPYARELKSKIEILSSYISN